MKALFLFLSGLYLCSISSGQESGSAAEAEEWPYALPLLGQKAIDAGEEIPLPFGISVAYYYVNRDIDVKSVSASLNDNPVQSVDDFVNFDVETTVHTGTMRADVWLLPFLNIYGLFGQIDNTSKIKAEFNLPDGGGGTTNVTLNADGGFQGSTAGLGTVLAAGYNDFFMTLDANYIISELGDSFNTKFRGQIYNARAGWKGKIDGHNTRIWIGATYWDTEREMSGSIGEKPAKINFKVVQKPVNPGNASIGFNYEFTDHVNIVADLGSNFEDATIFLLSLNYRLP